jgi:hypothetical protein
MSAPYLTLIRELHGLKHEMHVKMYTAMSSGDRQLIKDTLNYISTEMIPAIGSIKVQLCDYGLNVDEEPNPKDYVSACIRTLESRGIKVIRKVSGD